MYFRGSRRRLQDSLASQFTKILPKMPILSNILPFVARFLAFSALFGLSRVFLHSVA